MENRFFITDVYIPSGCRTLEHNLADELQNRGWHGVIIKKRTIKI